MQHAPAPASALTRLHITPLTPALLSTYIAPSILSQAQNISYHTIETFPEKSYGFVELPTMEAQKLKKKLNGSILKGSKVRIEEARTEKKEKKRKADAEDGEPERKKSKKAKGGKDVLPGLEIPDGRKVKRGWTEPVTDKKARKEKRKEKDGKKGAKPSKYIKEPEVLFKTVVPPNKSDLKAEKKTKKDKKNGKQEAVVHEFAHTTKHAGFLKSNQVVKDGKTAAEYVEGKGWVDADGNVIEKEKKRSKPVEKAVSPKPVASVKRLVKASTQSSDEEQDDDVSDESSVLSESSAVSSSSEDESEAESETKPAVSKQSDITHEDTTTADTAPEPTVASTKAKAKPKKPLEKPKIDLSIQEGFTASSTALEALYKRSTSANSAATPKPAPIQTSFSFFGNDAGSEDGEDGDVVKQEPQTPFTRQDMSWRGLRSAAPTPDTAAVNKRFIFPLPGQEEEDEDEEDEEDVTMADGDGEASRDKGSKAAADVNGDGDEKEESEFRKWFWEKRGENNRAWKKKKRDALKVRRQRENRRLGRRVV